MHGVNRKYIYKQNKKITSLAIGCTFVIMMWHNKETCFVVIYVSPVYSISVQCYAVRCGNASIYA